MIRDCAAEECAKEKVPPAPIQLQHMLLAWLTCFSVALAVTQARAQSDEQQPEQQLEAVNAAISQIESWINAAANNRSELENELRSINRQISSLQQDIAANQQRINSSEVRLQQLQEQQSALLFSVDEQQELVARAVRASYMTAQDSTLKLLLNQQDPSQLQRMLRYYSHFNESRLEQIASYQQSLQELEEVRRDIDHTSRELTVRNQQLGEQLVRLDSDRIARGDILQKLNAELASRSEELEQLIQDREHLEALIEEIRRVIEDIPPPEQLMPFAQERARLPWPLEGELRNSFGASYSGGNLQRQGVIIAAEAGRPVRAIHPGRVVFADWLRGSGHLVVVDHGDGYLSLYGHNQSLIKQNGDWVNRGEAISLAGENAGMDSPGMYFEIRHNGRPQDPVIWLMPR